MARVHQPPHLIVLTSAASQAVIDSSKRIKHWCNTLQCGVTLSQNLENGMCGGGIKTVGKTPFRAEVGLTSVSKALTTTMPKSRYRLGTSQLRMEWPICRVGKLGEGPFISRARQMAGKETERNKKTAGAVRQLRIYTSTNLPVECQEKVLHGCGSESKPFGSELHPGICYNTTFVNVAHLRIHFPSAFGRNWTFAR